jgi:porphobilinogen synthase
VPGEGVAEAIDAMPGQRRLSVDVLVKQARQAAQAGVGGLLLFGVPAGKDEDGSSAWDPAGPVPAALRALKAEAIGIPLVADVCLCEYTSHGHCGRLAGETVDNDATLALLARTAVAYAEAGADVIAPSDMMDGRVGAIRRALDEAGHRDVAILSYAVKYASAFYGPFREAAGSRPAFGDRRSYQMDPGNAREAVREAALDVEEGADALLVKPGLPCLDVIARLRERLDVPIAAYQVSGEYSAIKLLARAGLGDERQLVEETLIALRRSGADMIVTYFATEAAAWLVRS